MLPPLRLSVFLATLALPVGALPVGAQTQQAPQAASDERPVSGTFSEMQALRGDTAFQWYCATCHDQAFHTGDNFRAKWYGRTLRDLFRTLKTTMPDDNPGGLADGQYLSVIAYIMKLNGYTPGSDSLVADTVALKRIRIGEPPPPGHPASPAAAAVQRDTTARSP